MGRTAATRLSPSGLRSMTSTTPTWCGASAAVPGRRLARTASVPITCSRNLAWLSFACLNG
eukprot:1065287-Alexandrium_andersonii.AAC.1